MRLDSHPPRPIEYAAQAIRDPNLIEELQRERNLERRGCG
jgi:hypothetical protein